MSVTSGKKKEPIVVPAGYNKELEKLAETPRQPISTRWTDEQLETLRRYYPSLGPYSKELAKAVSSPGGKTRTSEALRTKAHLLDLEWTGEGVGKK